MTPEKWQQIDRILEEALEREPQQRESLLDEACAGDHSLRREVESLLFAHDQATEFIETPPAEIAGGLMIETQTFSFAGQTLAHYRILSSLGAGGMGEVYLALDTKLGRRVALKILPASLTADSGARTRFLREAQLASSLDHPHICTIHEIGETEGINFIAMQYVEGDTLKKVVDNNPLVIDSLLSISLQIADALRAAHSSGIIHRDIKSSNIIISPNGQAKVLDFGLAKHIDEDVNSFSQTASELTRSGMMMGTPAYMSPEQAQGKPVDYRSDIFSFGVVIYEMATGRVPFREKSPAETMNAVINKPHTSAAELNKEVPLELSSVIDRALTKSPEDRYQSVQEIIEDLRQTARDKGLINSSFPDRLIVPYVPVRPRALLTRLKRRALRPQVLAVVFILAAFVAAFYFFWIRQPARQQIKSIAVLPFKSLVSTGDDQHIGLGLSETLMTRLSGVNSLAVSSASASHRYIGSQQEAVAIGRELGVESVVEGTFQKDGNNIRVTAKLVRIKDESLLWADQFDEKYENIFALQDSIAERIAGALTVKLSDEKERRLTRRYPDNVEAYDLYLKGRFHLNKWEMEQIRLSLQYFEQATKIDPRYALAYAGLADAYNAQGVGWIAPEKVVPKAREAALKALEIDETLAEAHAALGSIYHSYDWKWIDAEKELKRALELEPKLIEARRYYSLYLVDTGKFDRAIEEMKQALEADPLSAFINRDLGQVYYYAGQYDEAIAYSQKAIDLDPGFATAHSWLDRAYTAKHLYDEAIEADLRKHALRGMSQEALNSMREAFKRSGWKGYWKKQVQILIERSKREYVEPYSFVECYVRLGDKERTFEWLDKCFNERSNWVTTVKHDPLLKDFRSDPRFADLIRRINYPQ